MLQHELKSFNMFLFVFFRNMGKARCIFLMVMCTSMYMYAWYLFSTIRLAKGGGFRNPNVLTKCADKLGGENPMLLAQALLETGNSELTFDKFIMSTISHAVTQGKSWNTRHGFGVCMTVSGSILKVCFGEQVLTPALLIIEVGCLGFPGASTYGTASP